MWTFGDLDNDLKTSGSELDKPITTNPSTQHLPPSNLRQLLKK